ncbi:hypothetical protein MSAN_02094200 [Mycena sanguinolenta]|uniref:Uncharacterized protein n=1 Tax=Mycena sanguinolenta TaxID=230812 RepID=A0A8H7CM41_9AGAR|nr:hypothetical protein MSAN_02094200 [Mycena sanguinolenta]
MYAPPSPFSTSPPTRRVNGVLHAPFTLFADASPPSSLAVVAPGATALFDISARHSTPLPLRPSTPAASDAAASFLDARHARRPLCSTSALLDATVLHVAACLFARCAQFPTAPHFDAAAPLRTFRRFDTAAPLRVRALPSSNTSDPPRPRVEAAARARLALATRVPDAAAPASPVPLRPLDAAVFFRRPPRSTPPFLSSTPAILDIAVC